MEEKLITLAIESSCDETAVAILEGGRKVLANIVSSQIEIHKAFGGVVPEIASRKHIENINPIIQEALDTAGLTFEDIDIIGVTYGPGLIGALLVGLSSAKALSYALKKPLVGVNHIEGHVCANYIAHEDLKPPFTSLIVSGGHTYLVQVNDYTDYELMGRTRDDAAGEAFDKVARAIGLPYPGGPVIDRLAKKGNKEAIDFPRVMLEKDSYDFSFSGLKTAVLNYLNQMNQKNQEIIVEDVAASFQAAVIDVLVEKTIRLAKENSSDKIVMSGGVAANSFLREEMEKAAKSNGMELYYPPISLCTDNAAMIGSSAYFNYMDGKTSPYNLRAEPNLGLK